MIFFTQMHYFLTRDKLNLQVVNYDASSSKLKIITARIRRMMTEGNIFSLSTLVGGGVPHLRSGWGYPIPGRDGGYPGVTPIQTWDGDGLPQGPPSKTGWGTPCPDLGGTRGTPPSKTG